MSSNEYFGNTIQPEEWEYLANLKDRKLAREEYKRLLARTVEQHPGLKDRFTEEPGYIASVFEKAASKDYEEPEDIEDYLARARARLKERCPEYIPISEKPGYEEMIEETVEIFKRIHAAGPPESVVPESKRLRSPQ